MRIYFETTVKQDKETVFEQFNVELFQQLTPPLTRVELIRFDGCRVGDTVEINIHSLFIKQHWISKVVEFHEGDTEIYFIDKGHKMPWPVTFWRHKHIIREIENGTQVIDDVKMETVNRVTGWLFYPFMWLAIAYRKKVYKKRFRA